MSESHFETLWEAGEELAAKTESGDLKTLVSHIIGELHKLEQDNSEVSQAESLGSILFELCAISNLLNINVYTALKYYIEQSKIDNFG